MKLTNNVIMEFNQALKEEEKQPKTVKQYTRAAELLSEWLGGREMDKSALLEYKAMLEKEQSPNSVNTIIAAINKLVTFIGDVTLKLKSLKIQKAIFADPDRELTKNEVDRLIETAKWLGKTRLETILYTLSKSGARVSELKHITVEAAKQGYALINSKGKHRKLVLSKKLCKRLRRYAKKQDIKSGSIFITRNGNPVDPSNLSKEMKALAEKANVDKRKVFPHNFRHFFARMFYRLHKDIARLADIMGHSSIETTRIYIMETGDVHRRQLDELCML